MKTGVCLKYFVCGCSSLKISLHYLNNFSSGLFVLQQTISLACTMWRSAACIQHASQRFALSTALSSKPAAPLCLLVREAVAFHTWPITCYLILQSSMYRTSPPHSAAPVLSGF